MIATKKYKVSSVNLIKEAQDPWKDIQEDLYESKEIGSFNIEKWHYAKLIYIFHAVSIRIWTGDFSELDR